MYGFRKISAIVFLILGVACQHKKKAPLRGDELVKPSDFIAFFQKLPVPFQYTDTALNKKEKDSLLISSKSFSRFVPDSVLVSWYGKSGKPKIYAIGRVSFPNKIECLLIKTVTADKRAVFVLSFDEKQQYRANLLVLKVDNNKATAQSVGIDKRFAITKSTIVRNPDGTIGDGKDVYALLADGGAFTLVMTDALNDKVTELINPIDTLPRKDKFSADYTSGKMNMVSVRDGRHAGQIRFFIHFEKNSGACTGELKGEALMRSPTIAEYREEGDPCVLKFIFSKNAVTLKEQEGCGSRRGLHCSFDGSFTKKKVKAIKN